MDIVRLLLGLLALLVGRRLFWLFIGIVGFLFGMEFAGEVFATDSDLVLVIIAILAGVVGAIIAMVAQRFAFALAGFFATAYFLAELLAAIGGIPSVQILSLVGGLVGAMVAFFIMDWALIILSSLVGAAAVGGELTQFFGLDATLQLVTFVVLLILGIGIQGAQLKSSRRTETK